MGIVGADLVETIPSNDTSVRFVIQLFKILNWHNMFHDVDLVDKSCNLQ